MAWAFPLAVEVKDSALLADGPSLLGASPSACGPPPICSQRRRNWRVSEAWRGPLALLQRALRADRQLVCAARTGLLRGMGEAWRTDSGGALSGAIAARKGLWRRMFQTDLFLSK
eukprot:scaffold11_cov257-Pinguiococcus_pyrenoidosus.AAC.26